MPVNELLSNIMQADQQARGLSGGKGAGLVLDESNPYYNYRLKRFSGANNLLKNPSLLWQSENGGGLGEHIGSVNHEGVATFTDALFILSHEDFGHTTQQADWSQELTRRILQHFDDYCHRESLERRYPHRRLGLRIICDGSADMGGLSLGLKAGEFVTGLVPNLYTGPVRGSYPVVGIHVNLPGIWEGYEEVGRLYNDQVVFTIGNHWLDNFHHPSLGDGAVYRLQQASDGNFMHVVNPDLADQYQVTTIEQDGANVLTLSTRDGVPLAYMVLAVMEPPVAAPEPAPTPAVEKPSPGIQMPEITMPESPRTPDNRYSIPPPMMMEEPPTERVERPGPSRSKTIIPDALEDRILTLTERGALLQRVHFGAFMQGYDVYVSDQGELGTAIDEPAATFQVRRKQVCVVSHGPEVSIDGRKIAPGVETQLTGDSEIRIADEVLEYKHLKGAEIDGWPYVGEIRRAASSTYLAWGESYKIGRSRDCRVPLPDEPSNNNILWKPEVREGTTIRSRSGPIPKAQFYTDSIMVSSQHAALNLDNDIPKLEVLARNCYAYIRRDGEILAAYPAASTKGKSSIDIRPGDELLIGNCLFRVGFIAPEDEAAQDEAQPSEEAPPPPPMLWEDAVAETAAAGQPIPVEAEVVPTGIGDEPIDPVSSIGAGSIGASPPDDFEADSGEWDADPDSVSLPGTLSAFDLEDDPPADDDEASVDQFSHSHAQEPDESSGVPSETSVPHPFPDMERTSNVMDSGQWFDEEDGVTEQHSEEAVQNVLAAVTAGEDASGELPEDPEETDFSDLEEEAAPPALDEGGMLALPDEADAHDNTEILEGSEPSDVTEVLTADPGSDATEVLTEAPPQAPPAPSPQPAPASPATTAVRTVVEVDDETAQFELGRKIRLVHMGWMVKGTMRAGNHTGADLIIPESRLTPDQSFEPVDYFEITVRGRRETLKIVTSQELLIDEDDPKQDSYSPIGEMVIDVIRRDEYGEEDFGVRLGLYADRSLPDPRARLLAIDTEEPLTAALLSRGLPTRAPRTLALEGIQLTALFDGEAVEISDYLDSYKLADGSFAPFFVQQGDARFTTMPEDGATVRLSLGDRLVLGNAIYLVQQA